MKQLATGLLVFISLSGMAQTNTLAPKSAPLHQDLTVDSVLMTGIVKRQPYKAKPPVWIVDDIKISGIDINYFDPNEIANISVLKNQQYPDGAVLMTLTNHNLLTKLLKSPLLSLNDISKTNVPKNERSRPVLFILDDKLLTDTTAIRIPFVCLDKVTITDASETPYFKTALPNVLLITISTKPLSTFPVQSKIMIRGVAAAN